MTEKRILLALFAIALGLRVLYGAYLTAQSPDSTLTLSSEFNYARHIASGGRWVGEPYSPRSPGYPVVLAALYVISFKQVWLAAFLQAALGALTVVVVYRLGRYLLEPVYAVIAALWFAFNAQHIHLSYVFERNVIAVLLFMLVLVLLVRPLKRMRYALVAGIAYTALIHVDPQYLMLLPVLAVFILFKTRHGLINLQYLFLFLGIVIAASLPWTVRNYAVYHQPLPIGLEAERFLRPVKLAVKSPATGIAEIEGKIATASRSRFIRQNAAEFWRIAQFRQESLPAGVSASGDSVRPPLERAWSPRHNFASIVNYGVLLPFFLVGIFYAIRRRNREAVMLATVVAVYFVMRVYLGGAEPSRLAVDPLIIVLAFYGFAAVLGEVRGRRVAEAARITG